jgi:Ca2+-binding RTX toxin-like protein
MMVAPAASFAQSAAEVTTALGLDGTEVSSSDLATSSDQGVAIQTTATGGFPTEGSSYLVLSSGCADDLLAPNDSQSHSCGLEGLDTSQGEDLVQLTITLNVPANSSSVSFDWKFYSEEYPEFVGSIFNDAFLVEAGSSNYVLSGANITAPNNVAFDQNNELISVNTSGFLAMTAAEAEGTTYDAATPKLNTVAPVPSGAASLVLVFSVFDMGDSIYDTTVLLDNVKFDASPIAAPSTKKAADLTSVVPATAAVNSTIGVSAKLADATTAGPIGNATIKWSMSPSGPSPSTVTDAGGNTTAQLDLAGLAPGTYTVKATFEGNSEYQMESVEKPLQITGDGQQPPPPAANSPPDAVDDNVQSNGTGMTIDPLANDSDPDGDNLLILSVTQPANGTSNKSSDGKTAFYVPDPGFNGTDSFDYTIIDGNGGNDTAKVSVTVNATAGPPSPPAPEPPQPEKDMFCGRLESEFDNVLFGTNANETLTGTEKDDLIRGWGGNDTIYGLAGNDCLKGDNGADMIWGGDGDDGVRGGNGPDLLHGDAGNDIVNGHAGADKAWGGDGNDTVLGETGEDRLIGDSGNDMMWGGGSDDKMLGEDGNDKMYGDAGRDRVFGMTGDDHIWGSAGNDTLVGSAGMDMVIGDSGSDMMWGGAEDDVLFAGAGHDMVVGDEGNDKMYGEGGNDKLFDAQGDDHHDGGPSRDECHDSVGSNTFVSCEEESPPPAQEGGSAEDLLAQLAEITDKYHDPAKAIADGYVATDSCVPEMGYHYVKASLASDLNVTELEPEVILYEPGEGGTRKLVGVEYFAAALANTAEGPKPWFEAEAPPMGWFNPAPALFAGQVFDGPMAGHEPGMPWHYDLHAWVWKDNPDGKFAPFNPEVSCG